MNDPWNMFGTPCRLFCICRNPWQCNPFELAVPQFCSWSWGSRPRVRPSGSGHGCSRPVGRPFGLAVPQSGHGAVDEHCCARACTTQSMSTFMAQAPRTVAHLLAQTLLHACTAGCALPAPLSVYTCPHPCHCHHHHCRHRCYIVAIIAIVTAVMTTCAPAHRPPPGGGKGGGGGGGNEEEEEEGTGRKG